KGWSAKEFNNIIDKAESGKVLTPIQDAKLKEFLEIAEDLKGKHPDLTEGPPEGDYESVSVDSLKEGETYTIIENKTKDGWDEYKIHKTKGGVTLEDGNILKFEPWDKVQVLKGKPKKIATKQPELVKEKPSLFGKPEKVGPKTKPQQPEKLSALDKVERQASSEFKQEGIWEPKQEGLFGKTKPTDKTLPTESIGKAWINNQKKPIISAREITKGKFKGKVEITLTAGRDALGRVKPGRKIKVDKKSVIEWPGEKEEIKVTGKKGALDILRSEKGEVDVSGAIQKISDRKTRKEEINKDLEKDRTYANRIHENRDVAVNHIEVKTKEIQRKIQSLSGKKSRKSKISPKFFTAEKEFKDTSRS
ncbi:MAG TPA: hypothetical protein VMW25_04640, partial [Clostridia bacterium]|nr:hypothetical protein [Clostridia bacterium]